MKFLLCTAVAAAFMFAAPAEASSYGKKRYKKVYRTAPHVRSYDDYERRGHNPTEPSSWRVGTIEWWRAMSSQGRAGRRF